MKLNNAILLLLGLAALWLFLKSKGSASGLWHWTLTHPQLQGSFVFVAANAAAAILQAEAEFGITGGWNAVQGGPA